MSVFDLGLCWIRRDLRLSDHRALAEATRQCKRVVVVFVYDTVILDSLADKSDKRVSFISRSLDEVHEGLAKRGGGLIALHGNPIDLIPRLAHQLEAQAVFANHDDDPYALSRDKRVKRDLGPVELLTFKDHVVLERTEVLNQAGGVYKSFTPYLEAWRSRLREEDLVEHKPDLTRITSAAELRVAAGNLALGNVGFSKAPLVVVPGERAANKTLAAFMKRAGDYERNRDFPSRGATSGLSTHLRFGTVSIREVFAAAQEARAVKWESEIVWREFAHMLLANFPHMATKCWDERYDKIHWPGTDKHFRAWSEGRTGVLIVDAAMRCLNETGLLHNRLRMVAASFLIKDLHVDWRLGEQYFAAKLLDYDLASNVYNWQWCLGSAPSAQPYFRVFNPVLQAERYDPDGEFVRKWCPRERPNPIVDHSVAGPKGVALIRAALGEA